MRFSLKKLDFFGKMAHFQWFFAFWNKDRRADFPAVMTGKSGEGRKTD
jgi:hypothetical protein